MKKINNLNKKLNEIKLKKKRKLKNGVKKLGNILEIRVKHQED